MAMHPKKPPNPQEIRDSGPEAMPEIKKMGFVSVINLRQATEPDTNIPAAEAAAAEVLALPIYGELTEAQQHEVVDAVSRAVESVSRLSTSRA